MTRLTKDLRQQILHNLIKSNKIQNEKQTLIKKRKTIVESIRITSLGGKSEAKKIKNLDDRIKNTLTKNKWNGIAQDELFKKAESIAIVIEGRRYILQLNGEFEWTHRTSNKTICQIVPNRATYNSLDIPVIKEFNYILKETEKFTTKLSTIKQNARTLLDSVTTVEKLLILWPEVKPFIPKNTQTPSTEISIDVKKLNAALKLPR